MNTVLFPNWPAWFVVAVLTFFVVLIAWAVLEWWRDRRTDALLRRGMRSAWRRGLLRDGDQ